MYNFGMDLSLRDKEGRKMNAIETVNKGANRIKNLFLEFEIFLLHIIGNIPSHNIRKFFYRASGIKIGRGSSIHMGAKFYDLKSIVIGEDTIIGENCVLDGRSKLEIGNHVDIASEVMIYNSEHDINSDNFSAKEAPVSIQDYVFVGPRAIILPGVSIGKGAVVGAGAVVTKDVPPYTIVGGVPAKIIGERRNKALRYKLGRARWFR